MTILLLPLSFFSSVRIIEAEVGLFVSMVSLLRLTRLGNEVDKLREIRAELVETIRDMVKARVDPESERIFTAQDFNLIDAD